MPRSLQPAADVFFSLRNTENEGVMSIRVHTIVFALLCAGFAIRFASAGEMPERLTPEEIAALPTLEAGTGTSGVAGIRTTLLSGNPNNAGLYTIRLVIPPHTIIKPHHHRDDRVATVVSGLWYIGYGVQRETEALKALPPGSFYTEPAGAAHFAGTEDQPAVVDITGFGPSDTIYVDAANIPQDGASKH
jgi:quercetin dioxygenase-like cupin family protein